MNTKERLTKVLNNNIFNSASDIKDFSNYETYLIKEDNIKVIVRPDVISIWDLTNVMLRGKVKKLNLYLNKGIAEHADVEFEYLLQSNSIREIIDNTRHGDTIGAFLVNEYDDLKATQEGINPFNFDKVKKANLNKTKFNKVDIVKIILNDQYNTITCNSIYTDDYQYDNASNFQKGQINDNRLLKLLNDLLDNYNYSIYKEGNTIKVGYVNNYYTVTL